MNFICPYMCTRININYARNNVKVKENLESLAGLKKLHMWYGRVFLPEENYYLTDILCIIAFYLFHGVC